jgi:hypothetical protein
MRRAAVVLVVLLAISSLGPATHAVARGRTLVANNCLHLRYKPSFILFACGDGGFYIRQAEWTSWHPFRATGRGVFHQNDCDPSCAGGTFHRAPGRIELKDRMRCPDQHHYAFARAVITFDGTLLGRHRVRAELFCPL